MNPEDRRKANILCVISLLCEIVPLFTNLPFFSFFSVRQETAGLSILGNILEAFGGIALIAGIILVIFVRVKYPQSTFGKVLMWIYIVFGIIAFLIFVAVLITCAIACNQASEECGSCLTDCSRMGFIHWNLMP